MARKIKNHAPRRVMSRRQPSLPGFPDIPEKLDIQMPDMPMWEQIGGDMSPGQHGALLARSDGGGWLELLEIQPVRDHVGDREAAEVGFPFWSKEGSYDLSDLDPDNKDVQSALQYIGVTLEDLSEEPEGQKAAGERGYTPEQRALVIAEALFSYGLGTQESSAGWAANVTPKEVKWWGDTIAGPEYIEDEDESFRNDILGYSEIRENLEKKVEEMADQSAAQAWSTVGDRIADMAAGDGFDPESLIGVAEFGDAIAINGELANTSEEKTLANVEANLEHDGYEMFEKGGKVPTTEEHVSPGHAISAVAREMDIDVDVVKEAAQGIEWWPKDRYDEIASSTSGYAYVYGKKDKHAHVEDGDYIIQPAYSDGTIVGGLGGGGGESFSMNDEEAAIAAAKAILRDPTFEGDYVTVITRDGELVWTSQEVDGGVDESRRRPRPSSRRRR